MLARKLLSVISPLAGFLAVQRDRAFLWTPVLFGGGAGLYFALPFEPAPWFIIGSLTLMLVISICAYYKMESEGWRYFFTGILILLMGLAAAQIRAHLVYTPLLAKTMGPAILQGTVLEVESLEGVNDKRLLLGDISIEKLSPDQTPRKVRLRLRKDPGVKVGQRVELMAELMPPSAPAIPGGFDFQRHFYFQGIGAVGFVYKYMRTVDEAPSGVSPGLSIQALRQVILQKIEAVVKGPSGGVSAALMINEVSSIPEEDHEAMRVSGLAHMLSISGLHVVLVAGGVFFAARLLMALSGLALYLPIKKIAAVAGFMAAIFYMLLAGSNIPVQRSVLVTGVMFLAIIFDRAPFSMRLVAFSALVVMLFAPESILSPSFQMSFAAVAALVWVYEGGRERWGDFARAGGWWRRALLYFGGICLTTLIASTATAPFGVYHFHTFGVYSIPANLMGVPVLSFIIMPAAMLALIAMPFGWEYWPLEVMGWGSAYLLEVAHWAAGLPGASVRVPLIPFAAFIGLVMTALLAMLCAGRTKLIALVPLAVCITALSLNRPPDILVADKGKLTGVVLEDGRLALSSTRREKFTAEVWESALGLQKGTAIDWKAAGMACDELGCRFEKYGRKVAFSLKPEAQAVECDWADVVVAAHGLAGPCGAPLATGRREAYRNGAQALWLQDTPTLKSAAEYRGKRLWTGLNGASGKAPARGAVSRLSDRSAKD